MKEVIYLGYKFKWNGGQEAQVEERVKKVIGVMRQLCGIGKRFGGNWGRRIKLFDWLVESVVVGFGEEVWGWNGRK